MYVLKIWEKFYPQNLTSLYYFVKKRLQHKCYLVKFAKYLRTLFFTEQLFTKPTFVCSDNPGKILVQNNKQMPCWQATTLPKACNFITNTPIQVLSSEICKIFKNTYFEEHVQTTASKHRSSFLEVFCRSFCSALINVLIKYSFSAAVVQWWRALHASLLKIALHHRYFSKNYHRCRTAILKNASWWLLLMSNLFWKHSCMAASQRQLQTYIHFRNSYTYFLLWRHVKEEWIFMIFF